MEYKELILYIAIIVDSIMILWKFKEFYISYNRRKNTSKIIRIIYHIFSVTMFSLILSDKINGMNTITFILVHCVIINIIKDYKDILLLRDCIKYYRDLHYQLEYKGIHEKILTICALSQDFMIVLNLPDLSKFYIIYIFYNICQILKVLIYHSFYLSMPLLSDNHKSNITLTMIKRMVLSLSLILLLIFNIHDNIIIIYTTIIIIITLFPNLEFDTKNNVLIIIKPPEIEIIALG